jgi:hypothetical protein
MHRVLTVVARELREMLPAFLFFLVVFHMLAGTQAVLQGKHGISLLRSTVALVGALTVAKSVLLVDALPIGRKFDQRPMAYGIAWRTLLFGLVTVLFHYLEELVPLLRKTGSLGEAARQLVEETSLAHTVVLQIWLWTSVLVFTVAAQVIARVGVERVRDELFHREVPPARPD